MDTCLTAEDMINAVPQYDVHCIDWTQINPDTRWWIGGNFDGDGCVVIDEKHGLVVQIAKAENGWPCLVWLHTALKGTIVRNRDATETTQAVKTWYISGLPALQFCQAMKEFTHLKQPQLQLASTFVYGERQAAVWTPVLATNINTGVEQVFAGMMIAAAATGIPNGKISQCCSGKRKTSGGYRWCKLSNPLNRDQLLAKRRQIEANMRGLKKIEHDRILASLEKPYMAGFVDADGCLSAMGKSYQSHGVAQKHRAICDAFQNMYGGCIYVQKSAGVFHWTVTKNALTFLIDVAPFLKEKSAQAMLLLGMQKGDSPAISQALKKFKGNQMSKKKPAHLSRKDHTNNPTANTEVRSEMGGLLAAK